jgi:D-alanine-D-alanine ligase
LASELRATALKVAQLCGARGVARIDFLSDGSSLFVNEINTVPGSLARYLWVDPAVTFGQLLSDMIEEALDRPAVRHSASGADGAVLRSAGSIASKLG